MNEFSNCWIVHIFKISNLTFLIGLSLLGWYLWPTTLYWHSYSVGTFHLITSSSNGSASPPPLFLFFIISSSSSLSYLWNQNHKMKVYSTAFLRVLFVYKSLNTFYLFKFLQTNSILMKKKKRFWMHKISRPFLWSS